MTSAIPDPHVDFLGWAAAIGEELARQGRIQDAIISSMRVRESFTIDDLARRYHCHRSTLCGGSMPWRLPNYGRPDFGESPKRWWIETVEAWEQVPEIEHREAWEAMSPAERRRILGMAA